MKTSTLFERGPRAIRQYLDRRIEHNLDKANEIGGDPERETESEHLTIYADALNSVRTALFGDPFDYEKAKRIERKVKT